MEYKTLQEEFWSGEFGNDYIERNRDTDIWSPANISLFADILRLTKNVKSIIEFGSNIGLNLKALRALLPKAELSAVEINHKAVEILRADTEIGAKKVYETSLLDFKNEETYDFVLIKGVLIHINPDELETVYQRAYESSNEYICFSEYYNPTPVKINYRNNQDVLFKRDFAGEFMDKYPDVELVDYGFRYHRDANFPQDDNTWFLMRKTK